MWVCVHCLSVHLCESLNSVSCFLLCFPLFHRHSQSMNPILLLLSLSLHSRPPSLSHPLPFSYLLSTPCWFVRGSNFHRLESDRGEADKTWAWKKREKVMEGCWWRVLLRGLEKPADISESHRGERWYESCCAVFFLLLPLSFLLCFPPFYFLPRYGEIAPGVLKRAICLIYRIRIPGNKSVNVTARSQVGT